MRIIIGSCIALATAALFAAPRTADACEPAQDYDLHVVSDDATDTSAPTIRGEPTFEVVHGRDSDSVGCGTDCGPFSTLTITIDGVDDKADVFGIGYDVVVESGDLPLFLEEQPLVAIREDGSGRAQLSFFWSNREAAAGTLRLTPIDSAGNIGEPVVISIDDPGVEDGGGCSAARMGGSSSGFALLLLGLFIIRRRRSGERTPTRSGAQPHDPERAPAPDSD